MRNWKFKDKKVKELEKRDLLVEEGGGEEEFGHRFHTQSRN
jgi:hypothetical protein